MLDVLRTPEQVNAILQSVNPDLRQLVPQVRREGWIPTEDEAFAGLRRFGTVLGDPCSAGLMISPEGDLTLKPEATKYLRSQALANSEAVLRRWRAVPILDELNNRVLEGKGNRTEGLAWRSDEIWWDGRPPETLPAKVVCLEFESGDVSYGLSFFALGWNEDMRGLQLMNKGRIVTIGEAIHRLPLPWKDFLSAAGRKQEEVCMLEMGLFLMKQSDELFPKTKFQRIRAKYWPV